MNKIEREYAIKITSAILSILKDEEDPNYIGVDNINETDTATEFMHALANIAPAKIYEMLTGEELDLLDFNHRMDHLVAQNMVFRKEREE